MKKHATGSEFPARLRAESSAFGFELQNGPQYSAVDKWHTQILSTAASELVD
jgi:hypothetical protein